MEQGNSFGANGENSAIGNRFLTFRLSWVAYLREGLSFLVRFLIAIIVLMLGLWLASLMMKTKPSEATWSAIVGFGAFAFALAWTVYSVALTRSVRVFTNDDGVWMQSGVFPWEKGFNGVQWRDVGQAGFTQGFASWALRSYDITVTHRFSADLELVVRNVHLGNEAVKHINGIMASLQSRISQA